MKHSTLGLLLALTLASGAAFADDHEGHAEHAAHEGHAEHAAHEGHAEHAAHEGHAEHGEPAAHGDHHAPTFGDVNWFYGFLGEKEGVEPGLFWRPTGMPVPFGALALNTAILYYLLYRFGKKPVTDALRQRKQSIMKGMEDAAKVKAEAQARLEEYEQKLADIDSEVTRIRTEMRESGEAERAAILGEAKERQTRLEKEARILIDHELKAAREQLLQETVRAAVRSAEAWLIAGVGAADQARLADEYLLAVKASEGAIRGRV